jgi:hypothetical protein
MDAPAFSHDQKSATVAKPFIAVRVPFRNSAPEILICPSQLDSEDFAGTLNGRCQDAGGLQFLEALGLALLGEIYDAAFRLFNWLEAPAAVPVFKFVEDSFAQFAFDFCGAEPQSGSDRAKELARLFEALDRNPGNNRARYRFLETLAFTFSRHYGLPGEYETALSYVERAIALGEGYLHLEACRHALELKRRGKPIPERFAKFVGHDTGLLTEHVCPLPFTRFEVNPTGEVHICCPMHVPTSIGNIESGDVEEIWSGDRVRKIRQSVLDGSFKYCSHTTCPSMLSGTLPKKNSPQILANRIMSGAVHDGRLDVGHLRYLKFGYDLSCNLSCPSCRREVIMERPDSRAPKQKTIAEKFIPLLPSLERLRVNCAGEFLVSRHSRDLLKLIDPRTSPNLVIEIISNGTLFSKREWDKFENIHPLVRFIRISMDAAFPQTFELVRRGGKWTVFFENLRFLAQLRRECSIERLVLAFTYQDHNFREMREFVELARELGADKAVFERIQKTAAMTEAEYAERAVHRFTHPLHQAFLEIVRDPLFCGEGVATDFDYQLS